MAGKMDWLSWDLPYEGEAVLVSGAVDRDVPDGLVMVNDRGVVQGVRDAEGTVHFGVSTVRPSEEMDALTERMRGRGVHQVVVTRHDGVLVGIVHLP